MDVSNPNLRRLATTLADPSATHLFARSRSGPSGRSESAAGARARRQAAVLVLVTDTDAPDVTFIERAATLRHHPGQIAFPGGAIDEGETVLEAALREAQEEIRLHPSAVRPLAAVPAAFVTASAYNVSVVLAAWDGTAPIAPGDPGEVAAVHRYAIEDLADPERRVRATLPGGYVGPGFVQGEIFIWGFTAHLLGKLLELGGWAQPWDETRRVAVPERFARDARR